jgi:Integrase core domain
MRAASAFEAVRRSPPRKFRIVCLFLWESRVRHAQMRHADCHPKSCPRVSRCERIRPSRVWINVTKNPTTEWVARQVTEAFPWDEAPHYLIRDRDRIYGSVVTRRLRAMGIRDKPTAPASPWQNGFAERLTGSIRRECVDHVIVFGEDHLRRILRSYASYYNSIRTDRSLDKDAPVSRPVQRTGSITSSPILGGLHHHYARVQFSARTPATSSRTRQLHHDFLRPLWRHYARPQAMARVGRHRQELRDAASGFAWRAKLRSRSDHSAKGRSTIPAPEPERFSGRAPPAASRSGRAALFRHAPRTQCDSRNAIILAEQWSAGARWTNQL